MKKLILFLILSIMFTQCSEDTFVTVVEADIPEHEPKLSIVAHLTNTDSVHQVFVSNSLGLLDTQSYDKITDADVELYQSGNLLATFEYNSENDYYESLNNGAIGNSTAPYELRVIHPTYGTAKQQQILPIAPKITRVKYEKDGGFAEFGERIDLLTIEFEDVDPAENYYELVIEGYRQYIRTTTVNDTTTIDTTILKRPFYAYVAEGFTEQGFGGILQFKDELFNGKAFSLRVSVDADELSPSEEFPLTISLTTVSADRYFFSNSYRRNREAVNNPFAEPIILYENIENGHGVFSVGNSDVEIIKE